MINENRSINDVENYSLQGLIAEGGMGKVYKAFDNRLQRYVAIKFIHADLKDDDNLQIHSEAKSLAQVNHENVMQVYDLIEYDNQFALVCELVEGESIAVIQRQTIMSLDQKLAMLLQISEGMQAVHEANLIHGDLKASNVLVTDTGQVKIVDFGLAHHFLDESVGNTKLKFVSISTLTPEYLQSAHQASASDSVTKIDKRADLFSFGVMGYELIAGYAPFGSGDKKEVSENIINGRYTDAKLIHPPIPKSIVALLNQLLQSKPASRPKSFREVAERIRQCLKGLIKLQLDNQNTIVYNELPQVGLVENKPLIHSNLVKPKWVLTGLVTMIVSLLILLILLVVIQEENQYEASIDIQRVENYVLVLRPMLDSSEPLSKQESAIVASIDNGLRQFVITNKQWLLLPEQESTDYSSAIENIALRTSATHIVATELDCHQAYCDVVLKVYTNGNWDIPQTINWVMQTYSLVGAWSELQNRFGELMQSSISRIAYSQVEQRLIPKGIKNKNAKDKSNKEELLNGHKIEESDYQSYLHLYTDINYNGIENWQNLEQLYDLIVRAPNLYPAYALYRRIALNLYRNDNNTDLLLKLNSVMAKAPIEYRSSLMFTIDALWVALYSNNMEQAEKLLKQAEIRGADKLTLLELQATYFLENNLAQQAIPYYQQALKLRFSAHDLFNLALSYWYTGQYSQVEESLQQLLASIPEDYTAMQLLASVYLITGKLEEAITAFSLLTANTPQSMDLNNLAIAYSLKREFLAAQVSAMKAVELSPSQPAWLLNLADIQWHLGEREQAKLHYKTVLRLLDKKDNLDALLLKAQAWLHLGEFQKSMKVLNKANRLAPDNGEVAFISALVYTQLHEYVSAVAKVEIALNADVGAVWFNLPWFDELCNNNDFVLMMEKAQFNNCAQ